MVFFFLSGLKIMFYFHLLSWTMISLNISVDNTGCILTELGENFASVRFYLLPKVKRFQLVLLLRVGQHHSPFHLLWNIMVCFLGASLVIPLTTDPITV